VFFILSKSDKIPTSTQSAQVSLYEQSS